MVNGLGHKVFVSMLEQTWGYLEGGSMCFCNVDSYHQLALPPHNTELGPSQQWKGLCSRPPWPTQVLCSLILVLVLNKKISQWGFCLAWNVKVDSVPALKTWASVCQNLFHCCLEELDGLLHWACVRNRSWQQLGAAASFLQCAPSLRTQSLFLFIYF